jgi:hypothetical protein
MHQVADFPHQGLVFGNHRFGDGPVVVEAGDRILASSSLMSARARL